MDHIIQSPGKYIQGVDVITRLGDYLKPLSEHWLIVGDKFVLSFENGSLAATHAIHNGLTAIPDAHHFYHGEKVAFGTLTQLVLENAPVEQIETVAALCYSVGLPITLAQLDITAKMRTVAEAACMEGETIHNMPGGATPDRVYAALLVADRYGQRFCRSGSNQDKKIPAPMRGFCFIHQAKNYSRSKRSRFITFTHAATKSFTNFCCASLLA